MAPKPVRFRLVDGDALLHVALPGGYELALEAGKPHETTDPAEIAVLDNHPAAERLPEKEAKSS